MHLITLPDKCNVFYCSVKNNTVHLWNDSLRDTRGRPISGPGCPGQVDFMSLFC